MPAKSEIIIVVRKEQDFDSRKLLLGFLAATGKNCLSDRVKALPAHVNVVLGNWRKPSPFLYSFYGGVLVCMHMCKYVSANAILVQRNAGEKSLQLLKCFLSRLKSGLI